MVVTVIIPVYNRPETLPFAVASILRQSCALPLDVLIIDDGSSDTTPEVIEDLMRHHPEIRAVRRENGGVAKARNTGLDNLRPDTAFVTFLDSDDVMAPDRFTGDLAILLEHPVVEITYGDMIMTFGIDMNSFTVPSGAKHLRLTSIHLSCCLFRRALIDRIGGFDESMQQAEDTDYILRIFESGTTFRQTETVCHLYLRHEGNMSSDHNDNRLWFARALLKSIRRRKLDPGLRLIKPEFNIELPRDFWEA